MLHARRNTHVNLAITGPRVIENIVLNNDPALRAIGMNPNRDTPAAMVPHP